MCYALFNNLYENRSAFVESLQEECSKQGIDKNKARQIDPMLINDRFHQCLANKQSFHACAQDLVREAFLS